MYTETTTKQNSFIDLSKEAQKTLDFIYSISIYTSPLQTCLFMQKSAKPKKLNTLIEIENYLINE
jgi:hypothetical protein